MSVCAERIPVLMYHRIDGLKPGDDRRLCVTPHEFQAQLAWLAGQGYTPCTAGDFAAWYEGRHALPEGSVLITFDDGYAGLHEHALEPLHARRWPATVFLLSGLVGRRDEWADGGASHALLSRAQIGEMARHGIEFHSHSHSHADLTRTDDAGLHREVHGSRAALQDLLGHEVPFFAYPYGRFDDRVQAAVAEAGYRLAFSVRSGFNRPQGERWAVRRLDIQGGDAVRPFGRKVSAGTNDGTLAARVRYVAQRVAARLGARSA